MLIYLVEGKYDDSDPMLGWMIFGAYVDKDDAEFDADKLRDGRGSASSYRVRELVMYKRPVYADEPERMFGPRKKFRVTYSNGKSYTQRAKDKDAARALADMAMKGAIARGDTAVTSILSIEEEIS
jgi:hypothetical protein